MEIKLDLEDREDYHPLQPKVCQPLRVKIITSSVGIEIGAEGFGLKGIEGRCPIFMEYNEGKWMLYVWSDINKEDPIVIDMELAREDYRGS